MMILIANQSLTIVKVIEVFKSLIWKRQYYGTDEFELKVNYNRTKDSYLKVGNFIQKEHLSGIIEEIELSVDENGEVIATVKGKGLKSLAQRRIYVGNKSVSLPVALLSITLVDETCINVESSRKIPYLTTNIGTDSGEIVSFNQSYFNLYDALMELNKPYNRSFDIILDLDTKTLTFTTLKGTDRTYNYENPNLNSVIFSRSFENVTSSTYLNSVDGYKTHALIAGEGDGQNRVTIWSNQDSSTGFNRFELFVDARDLQKGESTDATYQNQLIQRGVSKLAEYPLIDSYDCTVVADGYLTKWNLGDVVTVFSQEFKSQLDATITEVTETYEDEYSIEVSFGSVIPSLVQKIKRMR